ncbi:MAG: hypothetical protein NNC23_02850 [Candidatus Nanosynbacter sp. P2B_S1_bin.0.1]|jgi:hypothetical protein|nr:hypothetical protein [Candidatus Nanosynbacter sp. P2B_S1_bin.0.1]
MRVKKAIKVFEKIRDLPYGTSGSDEVWSCYQKCVLLKQELQHIGITSQLLIGVFDWQDLQIPEHILKIRRQQYERHVILRVFIDEFAYDVDPSIDIGLTPTLPMACWDGKSSTTTMVPLRCLRVYRPHSLHERILSQLRRKIFRSNPESFYTAIDIWLATIRVS